MANLTKHLKLLNAITLESTAATTQAAASRTEFDITDCDKVALSVTYTTGAGESSNTASVSVEIYDGFIWNPLLFCTNNAGTITGVPVHFDVAGASASTYYGYFPLNVGTLGDLGDSIGKKLRVGAYEAGVATNKGTITVVALAK